MSARRFAPLLRSPPFPHVRPHIAAVSLPGDGISIGAALPALIRAARVGGTFWAPPAPTSRPVLLRADDTATLAILLKAARAAGAPDHDLLAVVPPGLTLPPNLAAFRTPVDPWSLLGPGILLHAAPGDEWAPLAELAGATLAQPLAPGTAAAALAAARYRDPFADAPAPIERAVEILAGWRETLDANRGIAVALGISRWKRDAIGRMLWAGGEPLRFAGDAASAVTGARGRAIAAWPSRAPADLPACAAAAGVKVAQVEDGFIRSAGLGANLLPPQSIVLDRTGIYYDPSGPSDLEALLEDAEFSPLLLARAAALRAFVVARGISKYAVGKPATPSSPRADGRRRVLVTGQVEDDLSVRRAGGGLTNRALLERARAAEPDAHLLFKPHPDVDAGHRVGRIADRNALTLADEVTCAPIDALLAEVDALHVLTSLTGFEALLRGLPVTVHGQPFYAGWGLTTDLAPAIARRTRRRSLDELVAATLILYPRYLDPVTGLPCPPEILLERMATGAMPKPSLLARARILQGRLARALGTATTRNPTG